MIKKIFLSQWLFFAMALAGLAHTQYSYSEIWLTDPLYLEGHQRLFFSQQENDQHWQLLPEFSLTHNAGSNSKVRLGTKLNLQKANSDVVLNTLSLTTSPSPFWSISLGRQKIQYTQADLFQSSLSSNDERYDHLNYSQGLLATHRLAFIEQTFFIRQLKQSDSESAQQLEQNDTSYHYQISLGIPGYLVGPLNLTLESQKNVQSDETLRGMISSALQLPMPIIRGHWQWSFQYASEFENTEQIAWQTSLSWLGFIPQHKVGILWAHTDASWLYSDDFKNNTNQVELRYQWIKNQSFNLEFNISRISDNESGISDKHTSQGELALGYYF